MHKVKRHNLYLHLENHTTFTLEMTYQTFPFIVLKSRCRPLAKPTHPHLHMLHTVSDDTIFHKIYDFWHAIDCTVISKVSVIIFYWLSKQLSTDRHDAQFWGRHYLPLPFHTLCVAENQQMSLSIAFKANTLTISPPSRQDIVSSEYFPHSIIGIFPP